MRAYPTCSSNRAHLDFCRLEMAYLKNLSNNKGASLACSTAKHSSARMLPGINTGASRRHRCLTKRACIARLAVRQSRAWVPLKDDLRAGAAYLRFRDRGPRLCSRGGGCGAVCPMDRSVGSGELLQLRGHRHRLGTFQIVNHGASWQLPICDTTERGISKHLTWKLNCCWLLQERDTSRYARAACVHAHARVRVRACVCMYVSVWGSALPLEIRMIRFRRGISPQAHLKPCPAETGDCGGCSAAPLACCCCCCCCYSWSFLLLLMLMHWRRWQTSTRDP